MTGTSKGSVDSPPYRLLELIGHGSFGKVYKGMRKSSGELVAVKVLNLDVDNAFDEEIADTQKEIRMLSLICGDSPFCTKYHESIVVDMKLWIVMEYCGVGSVRDVLKSGVLEEKHIAIIVRQVLQALVYLHNRCNIIHRDIKSANILLSNDNGVKLCDFGVAGQITMTSLRRNSFVGSPHWMAPEVIQRASYDFKADIWSLGITIIEMALGNPPHSNQDPRRAIFLIPRTKPPRLDGRYSASMKEFLALCLREEPTERPTAEELLKTKFIRNAPKGTIQLADLIARHEQWKQAHGEGIPETPQTREFNEEDEEDDEWLFESYQSRTKGGHVAAERSDPPSVTIKAAPTPAPNEVAPKPVADASPDTTVKVTPKRRNFNRDREDVAAVVNMVANLFPRPESIVGTPTAGPEEGRRKSLEPDKSRVLSRARTFEDGPRGSSPSSGRPHSVFEVSSRSQASSEVSRARASMDGGRPRSTVEVSRPRSSVDASRAGSRSRSTSARDGDLGNRSSSSAAAGSRSQTPHGGRQARLWAEANGNTRDGDSSRASSIARTEAPSPMLNVPLAPESSRFQSNSRRGTSPQPNRPLPSPTEVVANNASESSRPQSVRTSVLSLSPAPPPLLRSLSQPMTTGPEEPQRGVTRPPQTRLSSSPPNPPNRVLPHRPTSMVSTTLSSSATNSHSATNLATVGGTVPRRAPSLLYPQIHGRSSTSSQPSHRSLVSPAEDALPAPAPELAAPPRMRNSGRARSSTVGEGYGNSSNGGTVSARRVSAFYEHGLELELGENQPARITAAMTRSTSGSGKAFPHSRTTSGGSGHGIPNGSDPTSGQQSGEGSSRADSGQSAGTSGTGWLASDGSHAVDEPVVIVFRRDKRPLVPPKEVDLGRSTSDSALLPVSGAVAPKPSTRMRVLAMVGDEIWRK